MRTMTKLYTRLFLQFCFTSAQVFYGLVPKFETFLCATQCTAHGKVAEVCSLARKSLSLVTTTVMLCTSYCCYQAIRVYLNPTQK